MTNHDDLAAKEDNKIATSLSKSASKSKSIFLCKFWFSFRSKERLFRFYHYLFLAFCVIEWTKKILNFMHHRVTINQSMVNWTDLNYTIILTVVLSQRVILWKISTVAKIYSIVQIALKLIECIEWAILMVD